MIIPLIRGGFKMLCPYCGEEMDKGFVQSARPIFWSVEKKKMFYLPSETKGDISIAKGGNGCVKESYLCRKCKKIIIDIISD